MITLAPPKTQSLDAVDYDLHGIVGIRLLNASAADARAVNRQLGPIRSSLGREPDITVRFVERLPGVSNVRFLGLDDAAFTDDAFLVLRSRHKSSVRVRIPFERIGERCDIVCETGLPAVPLLIPIVNLTALAKNVVPLHASAFNFRGTGVLTTGWSKGGKTETLLAFMAKGAEYVGDEWVYLRDDGSQMCGVPEPVTLWNWHLEQVPEFRSLVGRGQRARLTALSWLIAAMNVASAHGTSRRAPGRLLSRIVPLIQRQHYVHVPPERVFGEQFGRFEGTPKKLFFVASHDSPDVTVERIPSREVAERMVFSLQEERSKFLSYYMKFRFAFPDAANELIDNVVEIQRDLLIRALADKEAYAVSHPYPVVISSLYEAMSPLIRENDAALKDRQHAGKTG